MKKTMQEIDPIRKIVSFLLSTFASIFLLCVIFWVWNSIGYAMSANPEKNIFYFHSGLLWYLTLFSLVLSAFLGAGFYTETIDTMQKRLTLAGCGLFTLLFLSLEFSVIFFWV